MKINLDNATILQLQAHIQIASTAFGAPGAVSLRLLMDSIRLVLAARPPELIGAPLTMIAPVGSINANHLISSHGTPIVCADAQAVAHHLESRPDKAWLIAIAADRSFRVTMLQAPLDHLTIAYAGVVYHREDEIEHIAAGTNNAVVLKLSPISASAFADPTFTSLEDALDLYGRRAQDTACEILRPVWEGGADGPRLVFVNKPEHFMRESLFQALSLVLARHADVTREHKVDADKPVDVHVSWYNSPAEALIEIKWIGRSKTAPEAKTEYLDYRIPRAQSGANQLANYLDLKKSSAAKRSIMGYLVVFDGRRKGVKGPLDRLPKADALHYEHSEINYEPDHTTLRTDFKPPRRLFMQPRESDFLEAA